MLTRKGKSTARATPEPAVILAANSASTVPQGDFLRGGANSVLATTMDRRAFLKRSGLVAGGGVVASQLPYNMIGSAEAADAGAKEKTGVEVRRTVTSLPRGFPQTGRVVTATSS